MPEYLHPGVYIEEIERGPRPIEGVATSTAAFLGETERGPTWPRLVTSYNDYVRWFGGVFSPTKYMPYAVNGFFDNGGRRAYIARIVGKAATKASRVFGDVLVEAVGHGSWAKERIYIKVGAGTITILGNNGPEPAGFRIQVWYWSSFPTGGQPFDPTTDANRTRLPRPILAENFDDLSFDEASSDFFAKRINGNSSLITASLKANPANPPQVAAGEGQLDQDGDDDPNALNEDDFEGGAPRVDDRRGLEALKLDQFRDIALVYAPGITLTNALATQKKIITHCEKERFRFAVLDCDANQGNPSDLDPRTDIQETQFAAFYYPWIEISDPQSNARKKVPPGGHMLGIYARTDVERGVFKAPANEVVRGALDLEFKVDERAQDVLNPRGVNAIRKFPGRGILLWGARTLSANPLWKYVSVRRLFIFLEHSIYEGTQWVVFEPNDERLWARVKDTIRLFLRTQWREGALMGTTEQQAFFITCDRTTMTQDDILNGRLICEIGIAPVRPAEFVIFRIFQNTAEAQT